VALYRKSISVVEQIGPGGSRGVQFASSADSVFCGRRRANDGCYGGMREALSRVRTRES
jgi:hypothetical protein